MRWPGARRTVLAALTAVLLAGALAAAGIEPVRAAADQAVLPATVFNSPVGRSMPSGFVGVSFEYRAIHAYTGRDPRSVNPVLVDLLRGLAPGQPPVLRIGGDSTDWTWWPVRGVIRPGGVSYDLTKGWLRTTRALAATLGAKLILGINLASSRPSLAAAESQALLRGIGRRYIDALEIGNEPDLYGVFPWYRDRLGHVVFSRGHRYRLNKFVQDYSHWRAALPTVPLVGPSFAGLTWLSGLSKFLSTERGVRIATVHRYPLHNSTTDPASPTFPSVPALLTDYSSKALAQSVAPYAAIAHARGRQFRVDEMNSVSGGGRHGVSDTFAAALWVLDTLFNLASVGVDGVNLHTLPGAGYELFSFNQADGSWHAFVHPEYYGAYLFAHAFPPGARLLSTSVPAGPVKVWATRAPDGHTRVVLINKDPAAPVTVKLGLPDSSITATLSQLTAPGLDATAGVTLDGQTFGTSTDSGRLPGSPSAATIVPALGSYSVDLPAGSAAMLTQ